MALLLDDLRATVARRDAVIIVGAGVAMLGSNGAPTASWSGLLEDGISRCVELGLLSEELAELSRRQLTEGSLESWLAVAEQITTSLGGRGSREFRRWLRETVGSLELHQSGRPALDALFGLGVPVATTNYDGLLEAASGLDAVSWRDGPRAQRVLRGDEPGIVHLHGFWREPESVVLGVRSYESVLTDKPAQAMLRALATLRSVVLVGFGEGLGDPNFGALRQWMTDTWSDSEYRHFRLVRTSERASISAEHRHDGIVAVDYGDDYERLGRFLRELAPSPSPLRRQAVNSAGSNSSLPARLRTPSFARVVARTATFDELDSMCLNSPIVAIEGLSGSGKTFTVADYLRRRGLAESTIWYDVAEGSTFDDALTFFSDRVEFAGGSSVTRARELLAHLQERDERLVIDDFNAAAANAFDPVLRAASRLPPPARLLILSREYVELSSLGAPSSRLSLGAMSAVQIADMLRARGVDGWPTRWIDGLIAKAAGLPLAVTLFATAIEEFGHDADELLEGTLRRDARLKQWFTTVLQSLEADERHLLRFLSVATGPIDFAIVDLAIRESGTGKGRHAFEALQRAHLVEAVDRGQWSVHQLIAGFCLDELDLEQHQRFNGAYAEHFLRLGKEWPNQQLDDPTFAARVTACRHLQVAGRYPEAQKLIKRLSKTAKALGRYDTHTRLIQPHLILAGHDRWLDYDYAQGCLVLGRYSAGAAVLGRIDLTSIADPELRLSLSRIKAELFLVRGDATSALEMIIHAVDDAGDAVGVMARSQADSLKARIHLERGDPGLVAEVAHGMLARAHRADDTLGAAVGFTYLGYAALARGAAVEACGNFEKGVSCFREVGHRSNCQMLWIAA